MSAMQTFRCPSCARSVRTDQNATRVEHRCAAAKLDWVKFVRIADEMFPPIDRDA